MSERVEMPDPGVCTHDEWQAYVTSVDLTVLSVAEADAHRAGVEAYGRRLDRERTTNRDRWTQLLDERDETAQTADDLTLLCRELQAAYLASGERVLELRDQYPWDALEVVEARLVQDRLLARLQAAQARLKVANDAASAAYVRSVRPESAE